MRNDCSHVPPPSAVATPATAQASRNGTRYRFDLGEHSHIYPYSGASVSPDCAIRADVLPLVDTEAVVPGGAP